ncbi:MAG: ribosome silencing factor [Selenomonadaceae bacterium]|nr:ribosome silencing factor [Selenomonadaceae bacterium]
MSKEGFDLKTVDLATKICKAASDKKASEIITMDMRGVMFSTDCFVVCSAQTTTQVRAIADNIQEELEKDSITVTHREGYHEGEWILLDYGDVVAHIFREENRQYYALEQLWSEAKIKLYED